jgi:hypothetical protein
MNHARQPLTCTVGEIVAFAVFVIIGTLSCIAK